MYVEDTSPTGKASQSRSGYKADRTCGAYVAENCPGKSATIFFCFWTNLKGNYNGLSFNDVGQLQRLGFS